MEKLEPIFNLIEQHPAVVTVIVGFIYETVMRRKPTAKDWSLMNAVYKAIKAIKGAVDIAMENKHKHSGTHK